MKPDDLRDGYIRFFAERGHEVCRSDLLIPENDPTLLFTPAGMNQFKEMFLGVGKLPFKRAVSSQKCMRMPDLDNVGKTASHHTFFEMLGNFSFGDYFKEEAIAWSIDYLVKHLGLDFADLHFSVYQDDDESAEIWRTKMSVPKDRIYRFGEKDNFWPAEAPSKGPNGVCGPCSEIYVDLKGGCGRSDCSPACDCGRFVEVWNLVFTQFERGDGGVLTPLPFKNIDTGMGFERLLRVLVGAATNFDTELFQPIIRAICNLSGRTYGENDMDDIRMRRIADHLRASMFCITDGATPSNEKQGYVVRKVLRRAIMDGRNLGLEDKFLASLVTQVVQVMGKAYPDLVEQQARIEREVGQEEEKFAETYMQGSARLSVMIGELEGKGEKQLSGSSAFLLYDTFGFPLDLAERALAEQGMSIDTEGFNQEMEAQRQRARQGSMISDDVFDLGPLGAVMAETPASRFVGHDKTETSCKILHILSDEGLVESAIEGQRISVVLDETPFYPEAGGQVGDRGKIYCDVFSLTLDQDTRRDGDFIIHTGVVSEGTVTRDTVCMACVDMEKRQATERNHTATHLLHAALRKVLGSHVEQAGSLVGPSRLRFDFHHRAALKREELATVQQEVGNRIRENHAVSARVQDIESAKSQGAMALFGEKYGDEVRVVSILEKEGDKVSLELCGGTHVRSTGEIGGFRLLSDESIAAGIRRIEAATGHGLDLILDKKMAQLKEACEQLKTSEEELPRSIRSLQDQIKELRKELKKFHAGQAGQKVEELVEKGVALSGGEVFYSGLMAELPMEELRTMCDKIRSQSKQASGVLLCSLDKGKVHLVAAFDEAFQKKGLGAGEICKTMGKALGGGGGGRPNMAQGQGKDTARAPAVLEETAKAIVQKMEGS